MTDYAIRPDDLCGPQIAALIAAHKALMLEHSPPESSHALLLEGLRRPDIRVWSMWSGELLVGCGALKELDARAGELKSMHTLASHRGRGLGKQMLEHLIEEGRRRGYEALYLETGSMAGFEPARRLYASYGFELCDPFGEYGLDEHSVFMSLAL